MRDFGFLGGDFGGILRENWGILGQFWVESWKKKILGLEGRCWGCLGWFWGIFGLFFP